jgi:glucose/arabinose dehydrogenase
MKLLALFIFSLLNVSSFAAKPSQKVSFETLFDHDDVVWSIEFIDAQNLLFTGRSGKLYQLNLETKKAQLIAGTPAVYNNGQGGMLDVALHPNFAKNKMFYLTYSLPLENGEATTALFRGTLGNQQIIDGKVIFKAKTNSDESIHFGSRIAFDKSGLLFLTVGDRNVRERAQNLNFHNGKVLRLNDDGTPAKGNPYITTANALPEIWSFGHRNPQGLAFNPINSVLFLNEFGPRGGDEVNIIEPTKNYGWPLVSYGREYWGPKISTSPTKAGVTDPIVHYVPSISPSGMDFYTGNKIPAWTGDLFIGALSGSHLRRLKIKENKVIEQEELLKEYNYRFRDVKTGPDGFLYFSTDSGKIARLLFK